jgi:hypothetical protein
LRVRQTLLFSSYDFRTGESPVIDQDKDGFTILVAAHKVHGGFRLSTEAARLICERKGIALHFYPDDYGLKEGYNHFIGEDEQIERVYGRLDPDLVAVIQELGTERASAPGSIVSVQRVRVEVEIVDHDGRETVNVFGHG